MSGAAQAKPTTYTHAPERPDTFRCQRPETGWSIHSPIPRAGVDFDATVTLTQKRVYEYIRTHAKTRKLKDGGYDNADAPGYAEIGRELRLSRRTIARCVHALMLKGYVQAYERIAHGHRVGTRYILPYWGKVREQWRRDRSIALTRNGDPVVYGRGKRWMTPAEAHAWKIPGVRVPDASEEQTPPPAIVPRPDIDERAGTNKAPPAEDPEPDEIEIIRAELVAWCGIAGENDARFLLETARQTDRETPAIAVVDGIRAAASIRRKASPEYAFTPGWFQPKMDGAAREWRERARKHAREAQKQARWDRDHRINGLADCLLLLASGDAAIPLQDLAWMREQIDAADPEERAAAERLAAEQRARRAG